MVSYVINLSLTGKETVNCCNCNRRRRYFFLKKVISRHRLKMLISWRPFCVRAAAAIAARYRNEKCDLCKWDGIDWPRCVYVIGHILTAVILHGNKAVRYYAVVTAATRTFDSSPTRFIGSAKAWFWPVTSPYVFAMTTLTPWCNQIMGVGGSWPAWNMLERSEYVLTP